MTIRLGGMGTGIGMLGCCRSQGGIHRKLSVRSLHFAGSAVSCVQSCNGNELEGSRQSVLTEGSIRAPSTTFMCQGKRRAGCPAPWAPWCTLRMAHHTPSPAQNSFRETAVACKGERLGSPLQWLVCFVSCFEFRHIASSTRAKSDSLEDSESVKLFVEF